MQQRQADVKSLKYQYTKYKKDHRDEHPKAFWKEHEKEPWFMEKYHPLILYQMKQENIELAKTKSKNFWNSIPLPGLNLTKKEHNETDQDQVNDLERAYYKFDAN